MKYFTNLKQFCFSAAFTVHPTACFTFHVVAFLFTVTISEAVSVQLQTEVNTTLLTHPGCAPFAQAALLPAHAGPFALSRVLPAAGGDWKMTIQGYVHPAACPWPLPFTHLLMHKKAVCDSNVQEVLEDNHWPPLCFVMQRILRLEWQRQEGLLMMSSSVSSRGV